MALFRGIQEYIALDANNITLVFDSGNIANISGNIFLYPLMAIQYYINVCFLSASAFLSHTNNIMRDLLNASVYIKFIVNVK